MTMSLETKQHINTRCTKDPEAHESACGYDCFVLTRSFLRVVIAEIESRAFITKRFDYRTLPTLVEEAIRTNLVLMLDTVRSKRDNDFYKDLAYITGVPVVMKTMHDLDSYVTLLRNSFLRGIELGMIICTRRCSFRYIHTFSLKLREDHPRRIRTSGTKIVDKMLKYFEDHPGKALSPEFYANELRIRHISPYLSDDVFVAHRNILDEVNLA